MTDQERNDILSGATVKYGHLRFYEDAADNLLYARHEGVKLGLGSPRPRGGLTLVRVALPNGAVVHAMAKCSRRDNFCKAIGRQIALGRALKQIERAYRQLDEAAN